MNYRNGDPKKGSREFGEIIFEAIIKKSLRLIEVIQKGELLNEDC